MHSLVCSQPVVPRVRPRHLRTASVIKDSHGGIDQVLALNQPRYGRPVCPYHTGMGPFLLGLTWRGPRGALLPQEVLVSCGQTGYCALRPKPHTYLSIPIDSPGVHHYLGNHPPQKLYSDIGF